MWNSKIYWVRFKLPVCISVAYQFGQRSLPKIQVDRGWLVWSVAGETIQWCIAWPSGSLLVGSSPVRLPWSFPSDYWLSFTTFHCLPLFLAIFRYLLLSCAIFHYLSLSFAIFPIFCYLSIPLVTPCYPSLPLATPCYSSLSLATLSYASLPLATLHYLSLPLTISHYP